MKNLITFFPSGDVFLPSPARQPSIHRLQTHHCLGLGCRSPPYYLPCPKSFLLNWLCSAHAVSPGGPPLFTLPGQVDRVSFLSSQSGTDCQVPFCLDCQPINAMTGAREADARLRDDNGGSWTSTWGIRENPEPRLQRPEGVPCLWWGAEDARPSSSGWYHTDHESPSKVKTTLTDTNATGRATGSAGIPESPPYKQNWSPVSMALLQITVKFHFNLIHNNHWALPRHLCRVLVGRKAKISKKGSLPVL